MSNVHNNCKNLKEELKIADNIAVPLNTEHEADPNLRASLKLNHCLLEAERWQVWVRGNFTAFTFDTAWKLSGARHPLQEETRAACQSVSGSTVARRSHMTSSPSSLTPLTEACLLRKQLHPHYQHPITPDHVSTPDCCNYHSRSSRTFWHTHILHFLALEHFPVNAPCCFCHTTWQNTKRFFFSTRCQAASGVNGWAAGFN